MRKRLPGVGPHADRTAHDVPQPGAAKRGWWSIGGIILIGAALALAAAGLAWRDRIQLSTARPDTDVVTWAVLIVLMIGVAASVVLGVVSGPTGQQRRPRQPSPWWQVPLRLAVLAGILYALFHLDLPRPALSDPPTPRPSEAPDTAGVDAAERSWTQPVSVAVLIVLVLCVLAFLAYARRAADAHELGPPSPAPSAEETARTLARAAAAGRRALDSVDDERAAVIACYEAMQATLERRGVAGKGADTATDLLDRAVRQGVVRGPSAYRLVQLFGQARFAHDRLPPGASAEARSALRALEAETAPAGTL